MTQDEFRKLLCKMTKAEKDAFKGTPGIGNHEDEYLLARFVDEPLWNARILHALGLKTKEDEIADTTFAAVRYGRYSLWIGVATLIVAVVAAVAAMIPLLK